MDSDQGVHVTVEPPVQAGNWIGIYSDSTDTTLKFGSRDNTTFHSQANLGAATKANATMFDF